MLGSDWLTSNDVIGWQEG